MAVFSDPTGDVLGVAAGQHEGAGVVSETGAVLVVDSRPAICEGGHLLRISVRMDREERATVDVQGVQKSMATSSSGRAIGAEIAAQLPPHWNIYFGTGDVDARGGRPSSAEPCACHRSTFPTSARHNPRRTASRRLQRFPVRRLRSPAEAVHVSDRCSTSASPVPSSAWRGSKRRARPARGTIASTSRIEATPFEVEAENACRTSAVPVKPSPVP